MKNEQQIQKLSWEGISDDVSFVIVNPAYQKADSLQELQDIF